MQFYVTGRCHLKCRQCNIVESNAGCRELGLDEIRVVADNIRRAGGGIVLLTGGEPFLRKDIAQVAGVFIESGLDVRLQTAGIATDEQLRECYQVGVRDINISLDSLVPDKQDYINLVPGSWAAAIDAMERVSSIFRRGSAICSIGCVLSRLNFREIPAILDFATRIGWYLSLVPVHIAPPGQRYGFRSYDHDFVFRPEDYSDLRAAVDRILIMKRNGAMLFDADAFLRSAVHFIETGTPTWRQGGICKSPELFFVVRPNGDFAPCCDHFLDEPPSLLDPDFWRKYRRGEFKNMVRPVTSTCSGCHYGSFPEAELSVRDWKAFAERMRLAMFRRKHVIAQFGQGALVPLAEEIRRQHPEAYGEDTLPPETRAALERWHNPETRRVLMEEDSQRRVQEGRIRHRQERDDT